MAFKRKYQGDEEFKAIIDDLVNIQSLTYCFTKTWMDHGTYKIHECISFCFRNMDEVINWNGYECVYDVLSKIYYGLFSHHTLKHLFNLHLLNPITFNYSMNVFNHISLTKYKSKLDFDKVFLLPISSIFFLNIPLKTVKEFLGLCMWMIDMAIQNIIKGYRP